MKKYNIEEQLAEKLGQQSITPSADAWERIAHNRRQEKTGKKKPVGYYAAAVAACIILFGGWFFTADKNSPLPVAAPGVVHTEKEVKIMPKTLLGTQSSEVVHAMPDNENVAIVSKTNPAAKANIQQEKTEQLALPKAGVQLGNNKLALKPAEVTKPATISKETEADWLLANAYNQIGSQKQTAQPTNDTALLKEVEAEMNDYYRDKAMRFFALKHKTIRFAVRDKE